MKKLIRYSQSNIPTKKIFQMGGLGGAISTVGGNETRGYNDTNEYTSEDINSNRAAVLYNILHLCQNYGFENTPIYEDENNGALYLDFTGSNERLENFLGGNAFDYQLPSPQSLGFTNIEDVKAWIEENLNCTENTSLSLSLAALEAAASSKRPLAQTVLEIARRIEIIPESDLPSVRALAVVVVENYFVDLQNHIESNPDSVVDFEVLDSVIDALRKIGAQSPKSEAILAALKN